MNYTFGLIGCGNMHCQPSDPQRNFSESDATACPKTGGATFLFLGKQRGGSRKEPIPVLGCKAPFDV